MADKPIFYHTVQRLLCTYFLKGVRLARNCPARHYAVRQGDSRLIGRDSLEWLELNMSNGKRNKLGVERLDEQDVDELELLTAAEASKLLKIARSYFYVLAKCGGFPEKIHLGRLSRWKKKELVVWVNSMKVTQ